MKKLFLAIIALLVSGSALALDYEPEKGLSFMAFGGINASQIHTLDTRYYDGIPAKDYDGKIGGNVGIRADYVLANAHGLYLTAGLDWVSKGAKVDLDGVRTTDCIIIGEDCKSKHRLNYLEIPIRVGFRYNFSPMVGVYGEVGPYFAWGVAGKHVYDIDDDGTWASYIEDQLTYKDMKKSVLRPNFQRWDAGFGFRVGVEYAEHYNLMIGADWGITDMWRDKYRDYQKDTYDNQLDKLHNFNFTVTLGYRF